MRWISCSVIFFSTSGDTCSPRAIRRIESFSAPVSSCSSVRFAMRLASLEPHAEDFCRMLWILFRQLYDPSTQDGTRWPARPGHSLQIFRFAMRLSSLEPHAEDFCRMLWILFRQLYDPSTQDGTRWPARPGNSIPCRQVAGDSFLGCWQHAGRLHTSLQFLHGAREHRLNHRL